MILLLPYAGWHNISIFYKGLVTSTALLAAVIGSVVFGRLLDYSGRKAIYGFELVALIAGSLGSAFLTPVNNIFMLLFWRFLLGVGIGGDYATSSTIMTEYSSTMNRGKFVGMIFSMQSFGLIAGPLISIAFLSNHVSPYITWRLLLAIGAIPAIIVIYFSTESVWSYPALGSRTDGVSLLTVSILWAITSGSAAIILSRSAW